MKTKILLVRHGQSEANLLNLFAGHRGYPLTALGHEQAERTANYLKQMYSVDIVYSSDLPRAFQTAEHIALKFGLPVITDARFREIYGGDWEDALLDQLITRFPEDFCRWKNDIGNSCCTNGEAPVAVGNRVYNALLDIASKYEGKCIVVMTHAVALRAALWKISGAPVSAMQQTVFGSNCCVNELVCDNGIISAVHLNYVDHLIGCETKLPSGV